MLATPTNFISDAFGPLGHCQCTCLDDHGDGYFQGAWNRCEPMFSEYGPWGPLGPGRDVPHATICLFTANNPGVLRG